MRPNPLSTLRTAAMGLGLILLVGLSACHGVSQERTNAQAPAKYHIEYYQISER